ncbi:MAG TPA: hypothetical protein VFK57_21235 [Vicinamibacterales bacterium]|nr:hypothetical protein [Vicinamibacterales bacterium]
MKTVTSRPAVISGAARERVPEFLIVEYQLTTESLLKNEESGERRAAFFLTLAGAAGAVLAFAFDGDQPVFERARLAPAVVVVGTVVLLFGWMTVIRLIERQVTTDKLIFALRDLRRLFISRADAAIAPNAFLQPYGDPPGRSLKTFSLARGGWLESVEAVNAVICFAIVGGAIRWWRPDAGWWPLVGAAGAFIIWCLQKQTVKTRMTTEKMTCIRAADERQRLTLDSAVEPV